MGNQEIKEYGLDFVNHHIITKDNELILAHYPIDYEYKGSLRAGTGSKNRHRYEKVIVTWKRKFSNQEEASNYLTRLQLDTRFDPEAWMVIPTEGFSSPRRIKLGPGWTNIQVEGGLLTIETDYYIEDNT
jgi:hypothetical protein